MFFTLLDHFNFYTFFPFLVVAKVGFCCASLTFQALSCDIGVFVHGQTVAIIAIHLLLHLSHTHTTLAHPQFCR